MTFLEVSLTTELCRCCRLRLTSVAATCRLLTMAERGTKHEVLVAEMKLASLRERYDFSVLLGAETTDPEDDLFSNAARIRRDQKRRRLIVFDMKDAPIGNFAKWVLLNGFQIDGVWRATASGKATALYVRAKKEDLPALRNIAQVVSDRFKNLWRRFLRDHRGRFQRRTRFLCGAV